MSMEAAVAAGELSPFEQLRFARQVILTESRALARVADRLDGQFCRAVELVFACRRSVIVSGMGKAGLVGQKIMATLASTGTPSHCLHPAEAVHGDLGRVGADDVVLMLSQSGETEEIVRLLPSLAELGVPIVAITSKAESTLGRAAAVVLELGPLEEACALGLAPSTSTTAMLAMGDALAMTVLQARGFKQKDYARHHPSGAIGRALLMKVSDIMRAGSRNAVAGEQLTVKEALLLMCQAKSGSVSVIDSKGKLSGVFTDGDLRRHTAEDRDILARPLSSVMTRSPICIRDEALAVEALKIFNQRNIDDLIVVNAKREPVGLIDLQDLPKLKLM
jgi:arabinose-5-phosphate isomerase